MKDATHHTSASARSDSASRRVNSREKGRVRSERETVIRFDEAGEFASLWTASSRVAARWRRVGVTVETKHGSYWALVPKQRVRITKPRKASGRPFASGRRGVTPLE